MRWAAGPGSTKNREPLTTGCWTPGSSTRPKAELIAYEASLNVIEIARRISNIQQHLIGLAAVPTRWLERELEAQVAAAMPEAEWIKIDQRRARAA